MSAINCSEAHAVMPYLVTSVNQELSTEMTNDLLSNLSRSLLDRLSRAGWEAAGLYIADCITSGDLHHLCNYDPDVLDLDATDQTILRQCLAFFGKRQDIDIGVDREAASLRKFWEAEQSCAMTNSCFRAWSQGRFQFRPLAERVLHAASLKISKVLGDCPSLSNVRSRFGPGATTQTPKKNACPIMKMRSVPACSANMHLNWAEKASSLINCVEGGDQLVDLPVHPARVAFVPKNAKTDRAICTEPVLNGMFQLGIGELIASRLKTVGIDIKDQSANQRAALYGSISGASATLDLSSASDTVSRKLVEHLLPEDWYTLLHNFRSQEVVVKGAVYSMEKVSSMGNGFTFPLETLIFWALALSVSEIYSPSSRIRTLVYGDDIIVPVESAVPLMSVLRDLGFTPNPSKSFWTGSFRESCGSDYVFGVNVRPVFVDNALTGIDLFRLHNFFYARGDFLSARIFEEVIDPSIRLYGPTGFGDGYLIRHDWFATPVTKKGWGGFSFGAWAFRPKQLNREVSARLAQRIAFVPPIWDDVGKCWKNGTERSFGLVYPEKMAFTVRRLATYTQYLRETRRHTLTASDALRSANRHVYADRRMPDPVNPGSDEDVFVVPGRGSAVRTKIYIFEPPRA